MVTALMHAAFPELHSGGGAAASGESVAVGTSDASSSSLSSSSSPSSSSALHSEAHNAAAVGRPILLQLSAHIESQSRVRALLDDACARVFELQTHLRRSITPRAKIETETQTQTSASKVKSDSPNLSASSSSSLSSSSSSFSSSHASALQDSANNSNHNDSSNDAVAQWQSLSSRQAALAFERDQCMAAIVSSSQVIESQQQHNPDQHSLGDHGSNGANRSISGSINGSVSGGGAWLSATVGALVAHQHALIRLEAINAQLQQGIVSASVCVCVCVCA